MIKKIIKSIMTCILIALFIFLCKCALESLDA